MRETVVKETVLVVEDVDTLVTSVRNDEFHTRRLVVVTVVDPRTIFMSESEVASW